MLTLSQIYAFFLEDRENVLKRFKKVDENHFYYKEKKDTWSPELLFRHLLMSCYWMLGCFPGEEIETSKLALRYGETSEYRATINEIEKELNKITEIIISRIDKLEPEVEEEIIDTWWGKIPRQTAVCYLIQHDCTHLGQITWLFKRTTGWTDKEIYGI